MRSASRQILLASLVIVVCLFVVHFICRYMAADCEAHGGVYVFGATGNACVEPRR